jgi:hypothetical protein
MLTIGGHGGVLLDDAGQPANSFTLRRSVMHISTAP